MNLHYIKTVMSFVDDDKQYMLDIEDSEFCYNAYISDSVTQRHKTLFLTRQKALISKDDFVKETIDKYNCIYYYS